MASGGAVHGIGFGVSRPVHGIRHGIGPAGLGPAGPGASRLAHGTGPAGVRSNGAGHGIGPRREQPIHGTDLAQVVVGIMVSREPHNARFTTIP